MTEPKRRAETAPLSPDFSDHADAPPVTALEAGGKWLSIGFDDGTGARLNRYYLLENEVREGVVNPVTRERDLDCADLPEDAEIRDARAEGQALVVDWADGTRSLHALGWVHAYARRRWTPEAALPERESWATDTMKEPPTFDGPAVLESDAALEDWLVSTRRWGFSRLENLPTEDGTVTRIGMRIGTIRASNFGYTFKVETKPDPDSNAYTSGALAPHTDLASRETQPGWQLLHCQENTATGGASTMTDGFRIAEVLARDDPDAFDALTSLDWVFSNRHRDSDYRFRGPLIETDDAGRPVEIRNTGFLRAEPDMAEDQQERAWRAVRLFARLATDPRFICRTPFRPGDLVIFDNRRILHGRDSFDPQSGVRRLEGIYMDTDELYSRLRVLARGR